MKKQLFLIVMMLLPMAACADRNGDTEVSDPIVSF